MKNKINTVTGKVLFAGLLCLFVISSCKKVDLASPLQKPANSNGVLPPPAVVYNATHTVTPTGTNTETPTTVTVTATTTTVTPTNSETPTNTETPGGTKTCPSVVYPIFAGAGGNDTTKGTRVGNVSYFNDGVNLYVTSTFSGPTCPTEIQVWAGSNLANMPTSKGGVPFGQFPYQLSPAGCGTHTFTISLSSLFPTGTTNFCNKNLYIVLHAAMGADATVEGSTEQTAIAYGSQTFGGPRWGWIGTYPVCCPNK